MVSTRGVKVKFCDGERVLCYEPDPTKAKVLYDSKVLEVKVSKDSRGRKILEYLIHFQGWNSSWDRCVSEDFVLKDTAENRQLQRDLAAKSQLQLGAYLYRRDKKRPRKLSEKINDSLHENQEQDSAVVNDLDPSTNGPIATTDTDDTQQSESSDSEISDDMSLEPPIGELESIPPPVIELSFNLRLLAEFDYEMIVKKNKLVRTPAEPNVIQILEIFMRRFATTQLCCDNNSENKHKTRQRNNSSTNSNKTFNMTSIYQILNACRQYLDGLRIYFDYTLNDHLLYNCEKPQGRSVISIPPVLAANDSDCSTRTAPDMYIKLEDNGDGPPKLSLPENYLYEEKAHETVNNYLTARRAHYSNTGNYNYNHTPVGRRCLRSSHSQHSESHDGSMLETNGFNNFDALLTKTEFSNKSSAASTESDETNPLAQVLLWKLVPDASNAKSLPSFNYGAAHLLRLIIKLPEFLTASNVGESKMKTIVKFTDLLLDFLDEHSEWFTEKSYVENNTLSPLNDY